MNSLTHFAVRDDGCDRIIWRDFHPCCDELLITICDEFGEGVSSVARTNSNAYHQRSACCETCNCACPNKATTCPFAGATFTCTFFFFSGFFLCFSLGSCNHDLSLLCRCLNGRFDARIHPTTADIARHRHINIIIRGIRILLEQRHR